MAGRLSLCDYHTVGLGEWRDDKTTCKRPLGEERQLECRQNGLGLFAGYGLLPVLECQRADTHKLFVYEIL